MKVRDTRRIFLFFLSVELLRHFRDGLPDALFRGGIVYRAAFDRCPEADDMLRDEHDQLERAFVVEFFGESFGCEPDHFAGARPFEAGSSRLRFLEDAFNGTGEVLELFYCCDQDVVSNCE